ncbi:ThiF family protein [Besnoitia besnoiti]|uniref:ThiF family protein n=1 Tax=Besnoitia besnoiti TaxID=94643 RepID=A0A2A9MP74_BESBE|nr:ThiF family protein [Besnoitia besnoiti]PFH38441.1 ThiF family protein [Besnoitia besnoiti]
MERGGGDLSHQGGGPSCMPSGASVDRYDRQIRIWGEHGQSELGHASVLVLGSSATAGEVLKNLVLPGIRRFVVVDDAEVMLSDLRNMALNPADVGQSRAACLVRELRQLNPEAEGTAVHMNPLTYVAACEAALDRGDCPANVRRTPLTSERRSSDATHAGNPEDANTGLRQPSCFSLVIACQQSLDLLLRLSEVCGLESLQHTRPPSASRQPSDLSSSNGGVATRSDSPEAPPSTSKGHPSPGGRQRSGDNGVCLRRVGAVPLITVTTLGMLGVVRVAAGERCLVERKAQSDGRIDLRLFDPFPELYEFAMEYDLDRLDDLAHAQVPFVVILIQALSRYRRNFQGATTGYSRSASCHPQPSEPPSPTPLPPEARGELENIIQGMRRHPDEANFDEALANIYRVLKLYSVSADTIEVIEQASSSLFRPATNVAFWNMARGLAAFYRACRKLPVQGTLPDMTSDTLSFIRLQQIYAKRAEGDCNAIRASVSMLQGDSFGSDADGEPLSLSERPNSRKALSPRRHDSREAADGSVDPGLSRAPSDNSCPSLGDVEKFCRNAHDLKVIRYRSLGEEFNPSTVNRDVFEEATAALVTRDDDEGVPLLPWYVALWACHRFAARHDVFPGVRPVGWFDSNSDGYSCSGQQRGSVTAGSGDESRGAMWHRRGEDAESHSIASHPERSSAASPIDSDVDCLKREVGTLLSEINVADFAVDDKIIRQMVAFGGSEQHTTAAIVGGVAAQEAVKLICNQFEPINNTFIWNGIERKAEVLEL